MEPNDPALSIQATVEARDEQCVYVGYRRHNDLGRLEAKHLREAHCLGLKQSILKVLLVRNLQDMRCGCARAGIGLRKSAVWQQCQRDLALHACQRRWVFGALWQAPTFVKRVNDRL